MSKKATGIIAIVIGVLIVCVGIYAMTAAVPESTDHYPGYHYVSNAEFGADFYTYMYKASYNILDALDSVDQGLEAVVEAEANTQKSIHTVGGLLMICLGLGVVALGFGQMGESEPAVIVSNPVAPAAEAPQTFYAQPAEPQVETPTKFDAEKLPAWKRVQMEQEGKTE